MPAFSQIIHCVSTTAYPVVILPQSEKLLYRGRMYNLDMPETWVTDDLVRRVNNGYTITTTMSMRNPYRALNMYTERKVTLSFMKNGVSPYVNLTIMCPRDCCVPAWLKKRHNAQGYYVCYDDRQWKWKCIQRFLRNCLWKKRESTRLTLACGLHSRLGESCWLSQLPLDLAVKICLI